MDRGEDHREVSIHYDRTLKAVKRDTARSVNNMRHHPGQCREGEDLAATAEHALPCGVPSRLSSNTPPSSTPSVRYPRIRRRTRRSKTRAATAAINRSRLSSTHTAHKFGMRRKRLQNPFDSVIARDLCCTATNSPTGRSVLI